MRRFLAAAACAMGATAAWPQQSPLLSAPIACEVGKTCLIQNYVDHGRGQGARDYRCGYLTYDGHRGTDIRVTDPGRVRQGVPVLAAAAGRVRAARDGMPDISVLIAGKESIAGREAGNSVVIEHGNGWQTQYAHLRRGSIAERTGRFTAVSPTVVFWVQIFGARADDLEEVRLLAPDGRVIAEQRGRIGRNLAQWLVYIGRPRGNGGWPDGTYRGEYRLLRSTGEREILSLVREARIGSWELAR